MNKTKAAKKVAGVVVQLGTGRIVYAIINNNVDREEDKKIDKIAVPAASFVVGGMAAEATAQYTDRLVDEAVNSFKSLKTAFKKNTSES